MIKFLNNSKIVMREGIDIMVLNLSQRENKFIIPSDYVYLLLNSDGLQFSKSFEVTIDKINSIVEIDDLLNLEWLVKERLYVLEDETISYRDNYLKIASTFSQDCILIGNSCLNVNQVFLYKFSEDEIIKICDSLFEFINEHLI